MSAKSVSSTCPYCAEEVELDKHIVLEHEYVYNVETKKYDKVMVTIHPCVWVYERQHNFYRIPGKVDTSSNSKEDKKQQNGKD